MSDYQPDISIGDTNTLKESYIQKNKTELVDDDMTMFVHPRKGCGHCYGTGVEGVYDESSTRLPGEPCICRCITNKTLKKQPKDTKYMTYGEFRKLMSKARVRFGGKELKENEQDIKSDVTPIQGDDQVVATDRDEKQ